MRSAGSKLSLAGSEFKFTTCENTAVTKPGWEEKWESTIHSPEVFHSMTRGSGKGLSLEQRKHKNLCRLAHSLEEVQMSSSQHCYAFYWMQNTHIHQFWKRCGNWDVSHFNIFCWWLWGLFGCCSKVPHCPCVPSVISATERPSHLQNCLCSGYGMCLCSLLILAAWMLWNTHVFFWDVGLGI